MFPVSFVPLRCIPLVSESPVLVRLVVISEASSDWTPTHLWSIHLLDPFAGSQQIILSISATEHTASAVLSQLWLLRSWNDHGQRHLSSCPLALWRLLAVRSDCPSLIHCITLPALSVVYLFCLSALKLGCSRVFGAWALVSPRELYVCSSKSPCF